MTGGGHGHTMVGVGIFYILFWVGFVLGYYLGLHIITMLVLGVVAGYGGLVLITDLERWGRNE